MSRSASLMATALQRSTSPSWSNSIAVMARRPRSRRFPPPGRFGAIEFDGGNLVHSFREKPAGDGGLINGGYLRRRSVGSRPDRRRRRRSGSRARSSSSPRWASSSPTITKASGSRWTRCATRFTSRNCGRREPRGNAGKGIFLARPPSPRNGPHRLQGKLARAVAAAARRRGNRLFAAGADRSQLVRAGAGRGTDPAHRWRCSRPRGGDSCDRRDCSRKSSSISPRSPSSAILTRTRSRPLRPTSWARSTCSKPRAQSAKRSRGRLS